MAIKKNKVYFKKGIAFSKGKNGEVKNVETLEDAMNLQAECCGIDCCNNRLVLRIQDADGVTVYPGYLEIINVSGTIKLRVTTDLGAGTITKEVDLS